MQRRDFLTFASGAALATGTLAGCAAADDQPAAVGDGKHHRWTLALFVPSDFEIWGPGLIRFADYCRLLSAGRLDIKVEGAGEVVAPLGIFDAVRDGVVEMGHAASYFWDGKSSGDMRASVFFTAIPFGMTTAGTYAWLREGGGQELWDELYAPFGLKALPCGNTGVQAGGWFREPIASVDDLAGLTMRIPGLGGKVIDRVGGTNQVIPGHEIYTALETGRIDATEWIGPYHDYMRGFHEVAPHYYLGGWHEPGSVLELLINREAWDELDEQLQAVVRMAAATVDGEMYAQWTAKDAEYYAKLQADPDIHVASYPDAIVQALKPEAEAVMAEIAAAGDLAKRIHDSYLAFQERHEAYQAASELAYLRSRGL